MHQRGLIKTTLGVLLSITFFICLFVAPFYSYWFKQSFAFVSLPVLIMALLCGAGALLLVRFLPLKKLHSEKPFRLIVWISTLFLLIFQLYVAKTSWFMGSWDVNILTSFADHSGEFHQNYFSNFPNQVFLAAIFQLMADFGPLFGFQDGVLCTIAGSCVSVCISMPIVAFVAKRIGGFSVGYCAFFLTLAWVGLSPWFLVPYSDTYSLPWCMLVLYFYVCVDRRPLAWGGMVFACLIGYTIKPTVLFIFLSAVIVGVARFIREKKEECADGGSKPELASTGEGAMRQRVIEAAKTLGAVLLACVLAMSTVSIVKSTFPVPLDPNKEFSSTHFLKMGLNEDSYGCWCEADVVESASFATKEERSSANLRIAAQRAIDMFPGGFANLFLNKILITYNDGTFTWGGDGNFFMTAHDPATFFSKVYGIGHKTTYDSSAPFELPMQVIWYLALVGVLGFCFSKKPAGDPLKAMCLSLIFLFLFLLVFECRARYLYIYAPIYVILAVLGWRRIGWIVMDGARRHRSGDAKRPSVREGIGG